MDAWPPGRLRDLREEVGNRVADLGPGVLLDEVAAPHGDLLLVAQVRQNSR
jgi:hypothetical protein